MFTSSAYDLTTVAAKLNVEPRTLLVLVEEGHLPAIKVAKRNALIADADLYLLLRRVAVGSVPQPEQSLLASIKAYLADHLALEWLNDDHRGTAAHDLKRLNGQALQLVQKALAAECADARRRGANERRAR